MAENDEWYETPVSLPAADVWIAFPVPADRENIGLVLGALKGELLNYDHYIESGVSAGDLIDRYAEILKQYVILEDKPVPTIYPTDYSIPGLFCEQTQGTPDYSGAPQNSAAYGNMRVSGSPANGDEYAFQCLLAEGSYRFWLNYYRNTDCGILDIVVNGQYFVQGYDMYGTGSVVNNYWTLNLPQDGLCRVQMRVNGKRSAATSYRFRLGGVHIYDPLAGG